jgi:cytosine/adenosine deaminase-related metal-dependent hydrolase
MKLFIQQLDNGFTLTVTHPANPEAEAGSQAAQERKERLVFENVEHLYRRIETYLPRTT